MKDKMALRGALLTLLGGMLWGFSGTCGQYLLQTKGLTSEFIVPIRLMTAGVVLLLICLVREGKHVFDIFRKDARDIIIFGVLGMSMCQYTYFSAIGASNAGTATVLQYTGPVLILVFMSLRSRRLPRPAEVLAIALALAGTFLLATHGNPRAMVLSPRALFWGLLSAVALAVYTVQPGRLLQTYGSAVVTAWGMLIGGALLMAVFRPFAMEVAIDAQAVTAMAVIVLVGTVAAFSAYMEGVRCVGPKKGSLYASIEPVSAAVFSALLMGARFTGMDVLGFACILSTIFLLAMDKKD
ncbi:MAG: DMT family transporter [Candidatus Ventricola sp.]